MSNPPNPNPVVSNTTPLISLAEVELLQILQLLFTEIGIPETVFDEYQARLSSIRPSLVGFPWILVHHAPADPAIPSTLDVGERDAIALARAQSARLILMDEHSGRAVAARLGLKLAGSIAMLLEAKRKGFIPAVLPYLDKMIAQGRRIGPRLRAQALELADEAHD